MHLTLALFLPNSSGDSSRFSRDLYRKCWWNLICGNKFWNRSVLFRCLSSISLPTLIRYAFASSVIPPKFEWTFFKVLYGSLSEMLIKSNMWNRIFRNSKVVCSPLVQKTTSLVGLFKFLLDYLWICKRCFLSLCLFGFLLHLTRSSLRFQLISNPIIRQFLIESRKDLDWIS